MDLETTGTFQTALYLTNLGLVMQIHGCSGFQLNESKIFSREEILHLKNLDFHFAIISIPIKEVYLKQ